MRHKRKLPFRLIVDRTEPRKMCFSLFKTVVPKTEKNLGVPLGTHGSEGNESQNIPWVVLYGFSSIVKLCNNTHQPQGEYSISLEEIKRALFLKVAVSIVILSGTIHMRQTSSVSSYRLTSPSENFEVDFWWIENEVVEPQKGSILQRLMFRIALINCIILHRVCQIRLF